MSKRRVHLLSSSAFLRYLMLRFPLQLQPFAIWIRRPRGRPKRASPGPRSQCHNYVSATESVKCLDADTFVWAQRSRALVKTEIQSKSPRTQVSGPGSCCTSTHITKSGFQPSERGTFFRVKDHGYTGKLGRPLRPSSTSTWSPGANALLSPLMLLREQPRASRRATTSRSCGLP